ncbi:WD40 repeat domain-containing protein, partial [Streptomyces sp. NPDC056721]|uniref:WD40 repeat domain-containing protein n=1 Tax=Streptomyces sp. NPDC056721 TaxID=3345923 RepID=UPI00368D6400
GTWLATGSMDETVRIWDPATSTCTATLTDHTGEVTSVAIAPDGTWLATTGRDETVRIWDPTTSTCTATLTDHTEDVTSVAIAPDGTWLATTGLDKTVRIWDATEQRTVAIACTDGFLSSCVWAAGRELVVGGLQGIHLFAFRT